MSNYHPILPSFSSPVYCCQGNWIAIKGPGGMDRVYYVKKVERLWRNQHGKNFVPETSATNGQNPCLVYVDGEPQPWYFKTGWDRVRIVSFINRGGD